MSLVVLLTFIFYYSFFEKFDIVLNALDNVEARKHVNRLCLATNTPLLDAGTTGYSGQTTPIFKSITACYECVPKPTPKLYPICTIRSTPDKPVHCIVWAKECFKLLFNKPAESMLFEGDIEGEISTYMNLVNQYTSKEVEKSYSSVITHAKALLVALFNEEVKKRIASDVYKNAKSQPIPTSHGVIDEAVAIAMQLYSGSTSICKPSSRDAWDSSVWNDVDCALEFIATVVDNYLGKDSEFLGTLEFDKDNTPSMVFICAAANIRSRIFSIEPQSYHNSKGIAGNIIPAIATSNAIVAGLQVMQAFKLLQQIPLKASSTADAPMTTLTVDMANKICPLAYLSRTSNRKGCLLQPTKADEPKQCCFVCNTAQLVLQIDVTKATVGDLVNKVLKKKLAFHEPTVMINYSQVYEEGEGADEDLKDNLVFVLQNCPGGGIGDGTVVTVSDFSQDMEVNIVVKHVAEETFTSEENKQKNEEAAADLFVISGSVEAKSTATDTTVDTANGSNHDDDVVIMVESSSSKRKLDAEDDSSSRKSMKITPSSSASADVVELLD